MMKFQIQDYDASTLQGSAHGTMKNEKQVSKSDSPKQPQPSQNRDYTPD
ncbi:MAG: hypothetical protein ACLT63_00620 [Bacteroides xylanisolvens]